MIVRSSRIIRQTLSVFCVVALLVFSAGTPLAAQQPVQSVLQPLTPEQLDALVAPIALYPDALLSQVLVASTYPLEITEAAQWLQQNRNLQGPQLVDAARQQNWDPSIQALVVFPDVIDRLNSNIRWTTDLGNAFLAQQADVMNAVQHMRAEARSAGRLNSNTEETIATDTQGGQTVIEIQPTNPEVVYVPTYNPEYVWGPPAYGYYYPSLYYPDYGFGFGFGPAIYIGGFFGGLGWGGWGWGPNWFNCSIYENRYFFNNYGFRGFDGRGFGDRGIWTHNPEHRLGAAYPNQALANRFGGTFGGRGGFVGSASSLGRINGGGNANFANRGNFGAGAARGSAQFGGGRFQAPQVQSNASSGQWNRFGSSRPQPSYRPSPAFVGSSPYRSTPSYGSGYGGARSTPAYRPSPSFGGGGDRSAPAYRPSPSFGGGSARNTPSYRPSQSFGGGGDRTTPAYRPSPSFGGGSVRNAPAYRPSQSFGGGSARITPAYRPSPSFGGGGDRTMPSYRSSESFGGGAVHSTPAYRSTPSFGGGGVRTMPAYRSSASFGGGAVHSAPAYRSTPSFGGGGGGGFHGAPSFGGGHSGGSSFHSSGGGGSFHGGGGTVSHGGGGSVSHGGVHR